MKSFKDTFSSDSNYKVSAARFITEGATMFAYYVGTV